MMFKKIISVGFLLILLMCNLANASIVVIVNIKNPISKISVANVRRLYLGMLLRMPGTKLTAFPIDQDQHSDVRALFNKRVIQKSPEDLMQYWAKRIFSGKSGPPTVVNSDAEVLRLVTSNVNAIGYVSQTSANNAVKKILIIQ